MSGPYVIIEQRPVPPLRNRAELIAVALIGLYWIDRAGALIEAAVKRCEEPQEAPK